MPLGREAGVRFSLTDPFAYTANNVHGFLSVLEAARKHPVRHLVYAAWDGRESSISPAPARVYNLGNGSPVPVRGLVAILEKELRAPARIRLTPMQPGDVPAT